jgi:hypothetical protein
MDFMTVVWIGFGAFACIGAFCSGHELGEIHARERVQREAAAAVAGRWVQGKDGPEFEWTGRKDGE